ncbi:MAG TPA: hypothetical protein DCG06_07920, partial [Deltaproteobacteria bacterium]|nr:hypothetical protein [Deltaproteobacteria bacterium]
MIEKSRARKLSERLEKLSPEKRAAFEEALAAEGIDLWALPIVPGGDLENQPLSAGQEWLWNLFSLDPRSTLYNLPAAMWIHGPLDIDVIPRVLESLVRRHDVFRTRFTESAAGVHASVSSEANIDFAVVELSSDQDSDAAVRALWSESFDLRTGGLLRVRLIRVAPEKHLLAFSLHHIIADAWSMNLLMAEVGQLYHAHAAGSESPLNDLPVQYADFARWQRRWLRSATATDDLSYWKSQLAGANADLGVLGDRLRPLEPSFRGGVASRTLDVKDGSALASWARGAGMTLYAALLAVFQMTLSRVGGRTDLSLGSSIAQRPRPETENLLGFFVNTLVLRADLKGHPSFREALHRTHASVLTALEHQNLPFEKVAEALRVDGSDGPLFRGFFVLQNVPTRAVDLGELRFAPYETEGPGHSRFDLTLRATEQADGAIALALEYAKDLFSASGADGLLSRFARLLHEGLAHPDQPFEQLALLEPVAEKRILKAGQEETRPITPSLLARVRDRAKASPLSLAVGLRGRGGQRGQEEQVGVSFGDLWHRAGEVAVVLRG